MPLTGHLCGAISVSWSISFCLVALFTQFLASRLFMGYNYAIPAASLCMTRRLYRVAVIRKVVVTQAEVSDTLLRLAAI